MIYLFHTRFSQIRIDLLDRRPLRLEVLLLKRIPSGQWLWNMHRIISAHLLLLPRGIIIFPISQPQLTDDGLIQSFIPISEDFDTIRIVNLRSLIRTFLQILHILNSRGDFLAHQIQSSKTRRDLATIGYHKDIDSNLLIILTILDQRIRHLQFYIHGLVDNAFSVFYFKGAFELLD